MISPPPLTWIDAPPPPAAPQAARDAAFETLRALGAADCVVVAGEPGSGRRTAALLAAGALTDLDDGAYLVPAVAWRLPAVHRELARRFGAPTPRELSPATLRLVAAGALEGRRGLMILDARGRFDPAVIAGAMPPPRWRTIVLAPADAELRHVPVVRVASPPPAVPPPADAAAQAVLAAVRWFDPWQGAPRSALAEVAALAPSAADDAVARLLDRGLLRPATDRQRVLPPLAAVLTRPGPSDPSWPVLGARYVAAMAARCARAGDTAPTALADDVANLVAALAIWPDVASLDLVDDFAHVLPLLRGDLATHGAARAVTAAIDAHT